MVDGDVDKVHVQVETVKRKPDDRLNDKHQNEHSNCLAIRSVNERTG